MFGLRLAAASLLLAPFLAPRCPAPSLIELETVTAIQGELESTAAPNYIQALDRTRINTVKADLQTISHALEQYRVDFGAYPATTRATTAFGPATGDERFHNVFTFANSVPGGPGNLTWPTAYLTSMPTDPYSRGAGRDMPYAYFIDRRTNTWLLWSPGPDNDYDIDPLRDFDSASGAPPNALQQHVFNPDDPNDTDGDLILTNRR
jgi:Tfp pilus assembly protein PilE